MKKNLFFVSMAALALASCSQDEVPGFNENNDPLKIDLTLSSPSLLTKGSGAVGDIEGRPENVWNDQTIYVTALNKEDRTVLDNVGVTIDNRKAVAKSDNSLVWADGVDAYFPVNHSFDFYAYHVDDAAVNNSGNNPVVEKDESNDLYVRVKIDGTQDLLAGKAVLTEAQKKTLAQAYQDNNNSVPNPEQLEKEYARAFSAYTARRNVQPQIQFKHILTRFTFNVLPGAKGAEDVYIDSIGIESKQNAKFYFALNQEISDKLVVEPEEEFTTLYLKKRGLSGKLENWPITEYHPEAFQENEETQIPTRVGESLIVLPENSYRLKLYMSQVINGQRRYFSYGVDGRETLIPHPTNGNFEPGKSYEVNLVVYGLQRVEITTSLAGWIDGGKTEIDTEE